MRRTATVAAVLGMLVNSVVVAARAAPAAAQILLARTVGPPTTSLTVRGIRFGPSETVDLTFDGANLRHATSGSGGRFLTRITIPADALPGDHTVQATGETSGASAQATFTVRTDWAMFHFDPARTGYNPYENVLNTSNVHALTLAWSFTTGGAVEGSPVVANGILYVGSHDDNLYALDADTGAVVWTFPSTGEVGTPAVVDGVVYVVTGFPFPNLYAIDAATGAVLWQTDVSGGFQDAPPVVVDGVVYVASHLLYAVDAATGTVLWTFDQASFDQCIVAVDHGMVFAATLDDGVYAIDAATGALIWIFPRELYGQMAPAVSGGSVFVGSLEGTMWALGERSQQIRWQFPAGDISSTAAVAGGLVYVGTGEGTEWALDAATGRKVWRFATGSGITESSPAVANGVVYVGSTDHNLYAIDTATGAALWAFPTGADILSSPAVANGMVFVGSYDHTIYAFGLRHYR
jgi:outer membrane protein assembly factor BamB